MLGKTTRNPLGDIDTEMGVRSKNQTMQTGDSASFFFFAFHHYTVGNGWVCSADKELKSILEVLHVKLYGGIAEKTHSAFLFN